MAYLVYPANPKYGVLRIDAVDFDVTTSDDELFFEDEDGEYIAYFPLHQICGFVKVP